MKVFMHYFFKDYLLLLRVNLINKSFLNNSKKLIIYNLVC